MEVVTVTVATGDSCNREVLVSRDTTGDMVQWQRWQSAVVYGDSADSDDSGEW
jgi:hypothetical protein